MARSRFLDYPRQRVLAVVDDPAAVDPALQALRAASFADTDVNVLRGAAAASQFDATGEGHGFLSRLVRAVQFSLMDQMPDFAWYEAALQMGRVALSVRAPDLGTATRVKAALEPVGAHFINYFGRWETAELLDWRGPEPPVSGVLKR